MDLGNLHSKVGVCLSNFPRGMGVGRSQFALADLSLPRRYLTAACTVIFLSIVSILKLITVRHGDQAVVWGPRAYLLHVCDLDFVKLAGNCRMNAQMAVNSAYQLHC